ncbi:hypothetical protein TorRG33x02_249650 [Trema orientale]|uniref:Uncharacterized protein n=1 Tax=Trema orientale TaxID=63057 RepID=A0A2P5DJK5_TREOI|nr:hypothetical protein TorRG33x02_249650 [Trema orientale]
MRLNVRETSSTHRSQTTFSSILSSMTTPILSLLLPPPPPEHGDKGHLFLAIWVSAGVLINGGNYYWAGVELQALSSKREMRIRARGKKSKKVVCF